MGKSQGYVAHVSVHAVQIPNILYFTVLTICAPLWEEVRILGIVHNLVQFFHH